MKGPSSKPRAYSVAPDATDLLLIVPVLSPLTPEFIGSLEFLPREIDISLIGKTVPKDLAPGLAQLSIGRRVRWINAPKGADLATLVHTAAKSSERDYLWVLTPDLRIHEENLEILLTSLLVEPRSIFYFDSDNKGWGFTDQLQSLLVGPLPFQKGLCLSKENLGRFERAYFARIWAALRRGSRLRCLGEMTSIVKDTPLNRVD